MKKYIITILGKDQPGIIAAVSQVLFEMDFNIEDIRQTILQCEFSGIFIAQGPGNVSCDQLRKAVLTATDQLNLYCHVKTMDPALPYWTGDEVEAFVLSTRGPDCKGLVAQITAILADYHVNISQLHAVFRGGNAPDDNIMVYEIDIPTSVDLNNLRRALQAKAGQLNLEINFQHKSIFESINRV